MRAAILSTGDELTTGRTLDTNANFIADQLLANGIDVTSMMTVGDYPERIEWAWQTLFAEADVVVSTGGLGPTADDLTTETVAKMIGRDLYLDEEVANHIRRLFESISRRMPENNLKQAMFPEGAVIIPNGLGTAPGFRIDIDTPHGRRTGVVLPGVPREMKKMLAEEVLPWLRSLRDDNLEFRSHTFQTFGISESALDELVAGAVDTNEVRVAFRAAFPQISVRITVQAVPEEVERRIEEAASRVRERLGEHCYSEGQTDMETEVGRLLSDSGHSLAVAESCSGGLIGHRLTDVPGSSAYLLGGVVAYNNAVKQSVLGVAPEILRDHGAVSCEVAEQMARGVRRLLGASIGLATTGIAGPSGGTEEKPVGTVCIAIDHGGGRTSHRYQLWGTRDWIKLLTSQIALDWIRRAELGKDPTAADILRK
jgi:nicotinamide-nucleotide amidase